jgi:ABC-type molybdenum transport system ATPase subunit/photorepair protein PhrA
MPELPARSGVTLLRAEEVTVRGRLDRPVALALESGARLVVTGPNGAGKSTLLSVLAAADLRNPLRDLSMGQQRRLTSFLNDP